MSKMNKEDANLMAQAIDNRIIQIAKQVYREVPNDREVEGLIVAFDSKYNNYTVRINNSEYEAIPQERTIGPIEIGTRVKVKVPNNQMSNAYICGIVDGTIKEEKQNVVYPLPMGMIIPSAIIQNDPALHLLDGGEILIGGIYDDFCQFIIKNTDRVATCSLSDYQTELTTYGQCGKFVITDTYVKLPTITKFIEGLSDISNLATNVAAGLPNIKGTADLHLNKGARTGAYGDTSRGGYAVSWQNNTFWAGSGMDFDASLYNPIYGNSTTVQPPSVKYPYYIVIGNVLVNQINIDINNALNEINNKADKNLNNVTYPSIISGSTTTGSGDRVIEQYVSSDGKTWYRKWASGWKECGTVYTSSSGYGTWNMPITFSSTNYVAVATIRTSESSTNSYMAQANPLSSSSVRITKRYENGSNRGYAAEDASVYCCGY